MDVPYVYRPPEPWLQPHPHGLRYEPSGENVVEGAESGWACARPGPGSPAAGVPAPSERHLQTREAR
jgi:hypothetical protein